MSEEQLSYRIEVPATSANLGVGFDCLGMALDLYASFDVAFADTLTITGCEERFRGEDNLVWTSYLHACRELGFEERPLSIHIDSPIPHSGGLGSSSTCVVAGIAAAEFLHTNVLELENTLSLACALEGHPDNVAPAILGGVVSAFITEDEVHTVRYDISDKLRFVAIAPQVEVLTEDARASMPKQVPLELAVWQTGRCVPTVHALATGDTDLLAAACRDRLHEPYRKKLIPGYEAAREAALAAGAAAFFISGSGSTMIAVTEGDESAEKVADALRSSDPEAWVRICRGSSEGLRFRA